MEGFIGLLVLTSALICWILGGIKYVQGGGGFQFLAHVGLCIGLVLVYWVLIVLPVLDCNGFLCGLDEMLLFALLGYFTVLLWGILVLVLGKRKHDNSLRSSKKNQVIDEIVKTYEEF